MDDCHFGYITGLTRKKHQMELGPIKSQNRVLSPIERLDES
jgi:hypothetical protein